MHRANHDAQYECEWKPGFKCSHLRPKLQSTSVGSELTNGISLGIPLEPPVCRKTCRNGAPPQGFALPRLAARPCAVRAVPAVSAPRRAAPAGSLKENYVKTYLTPTSLFMEAINSRSDLSTYGVTARDFGILERRMRRLSRGANPTSVSPLFSIFRGELTHQGAATATPACWFG